MLREPPYNDNAGRDDYGDDDAPSLTDVLRAALEPVAAKIDAAFIYGPLARGISKAHGDVDLIIIGRGIDYTDVIPRFIEARKYLGRTINPGVYTVQEWRRKLVAGNRVMLAVMKQPKIFLIGSQDSIPQAT